MSKIVKQLELDHLRSTFKDVRDFVLLEPMKVDSATEFDFRKKLRGKQVRVKMVKNSYTRKLFKEFGINVETGGGPTLLCWGGTSVKDLSNAVDTAVKEARKDPKSPEKFKVKAAIADGQTITMDLAKTLPTRLEAIGELIGAVLSPGSSIAGALVGPATQLAGILKAIEEKTPDAAPAAAPDAAPAA